MQQEYMGRGCILNLPKILKQYSFKKVFMVTGKASYVDSGAKSVLEPLLSGMDVERFCDYSSNPNFKEVMRGVNCFRSGEFDCIIAVGGGSAIDAAKAINALSGNSGDELNIATGAVNLNKPLIPLIAIPTTAGTGSEATHFAVIYINGEKYSLTSNHLRPDVAIIDSKFTERLPTDVTAHSGFDALCQAVESYWSKGATVESRGYAKQAIELLLESLPAAVNNPDLISRGRVMIAANLAGKAINISKTTAPHALSYGITSRYGLPHGYAVALTLGTFFEFHENALWKSKDVFEPLTKISAELFALFNVENAHSAMSFWYKFMLTCGLETSFTKLGICIGELTKVVDAVNIERLNNHPIKLDRPALLELMSFLVNEHHIKEF